jgi:hypothetical protein
MSHITRDFNIVLYLLGVFRVGNEEIRCSKSNEPIYVKIINDMMIHLLTAIGLTPGGSNTVNIHTQTIHGTTQR